MGRKMQLNEEDEAIFKRAVKSQYSSNMYKNLKRDHRLERFKMVLQVCATRGMNLNQTCIYLTKLFPSYVKGKTLTVKTLSAMISFYPDIEEAWGFSADLGKMLAYNRAVELVDNATDINTIDKFNDMYDNGDLLYIKKEDKLKDSGSIGGDVEKLEVNLFNSRDKGDIVE